MTRTEGKAAAAILDLLTGPEPWSLIEIHAHLKRQGFAKGTISSAFQCLRKGELIHRRDGGGFHCVPRKR